jgi:hypothetical protein
MVNSIAGAISNGFKLLKTILDTKVTRDMRKAIESAEKYIQVAERDGQYMDLKVTERSKLLARYRKRFFKYN